MINKVYEKTKNYIKENYKQLLLLIILFIVLTIKLPYYISSPGGLLDTKDKVKIDTDFKLSGSLNMAYVSEARATLPILIYALINPNWDIEKEEEVTTGNESIEDVMYRNKLLLKEGNNLATLVALKHSDIKYKTKNNKIFVTYIDNEAKTNLKVKDQIIEIDGNKIKEKQDLYDYIETKKPNDKIKFTVIRNKKEKEVTAKLLNINNEPKVGIIITETLDIKSDYDINFKFKNSESGSSGGMMLALTIYSYINKEDLTHGKKIVGTGTIDGNGNVGEISGVKYKLMGAVKEKADLFLVPQGKNYEEAKKIKQEKGYDIDLVPVETFEDALNYLKNLN